MARNSTLVMSGRAIRVLLVLNWVVGGLILSLLIASLAAEAQVMGALGARPAPGNAARITGMRQIMVLGVLAVPLGHIVLSRLLAIVGSVRSGDPFIAENALRLRMIAWSLLGLQLLHLFVGAVARAGSSELAPLDIDWNFSLGGWLAVLLLFVLAQVFEHGSRMREELEATI